MHAHWRINKFKFKKERTRINGHQTGLPTKPFADQLDGNPTGNSSQKNLGCYFCGQEGHFKRQRQLWREQRVKRQNSFLENQTNGGETKTHSSPKPAPISQPGAANNQIKGARGAYVQVSLERRKYWTLLDTGCEVSISIPLFRQAVSTQPINLSGQRMVRL